MAHSRRNNQRALMLLGFVLQGALQGAQTLEAQGSRTPPATGSASAPTMTDPLARALDAEDKGDRQRASTAYKEVVTQVMADGGSDGNKLAVAMLGLERVWYEQGALDSIVPMVRRILQRRPTDPTAHQIHLRTLVAMGRDEDARFAFVAWRRAVGNDGAPFREYARLLMQRGRSLAADSVLREATRLLGTAGAITGETAQLHVSLGRWFEAATAYRNALVDQPYLETAALYGMQRAPGAARDSIRSVLSAPPAELVTRRLLSSLEFAWNEPRRAWVAMSTLPPNDSTIAAWRAFGERAELNQSWLVAREAWRAVFTRTGDLESQRRSAEAALRSGDATLALSILHTKPRSGDTTSANVRTRALLPIEIEALGESGKVADAQAALDRERSRLDATSVSMLTRPLVNAWLRAGDIEKARRAMADTDLQEDDEIAGALALYEGDLVTARRHLVRAASQRAELVDALGLLARVRLDRSPAVGRAFLTLARRDSVAAAAQFAALADSVGAAAPAVLALSARIGRAEAAVPLWERIVGTYPRSPEAPESLLAWARLLRARGDTAGARTRLEQLLVDYTNSALAPQARRELEQLKGTVPPSDAVAERSVAFAIPTRFP